jgi:hypothetical protein
MKALIKRRNIFNIINIETAIRFIIYYINNSRKVLISITNNGENIIELTYLLNYHMILQHIHLCDQGFDNSLYNEVKIQMY